MASFRCALIPLFLILWGSCTQPSDTMQSSTTSTSLMQFTPGTYSAPAISFVGLYHVELTEEGHLTYKQIISAHLPPAEIHVHSTKLIAQSEGPPCFESAPKGIRRCLIAMDSESLTLYDETEEAVIRLACTREE